MPTETVALPPVQFRRKKLDSIRIPKGRIVADETVAGDISESVTETGFWSVVVVSHDGWLVAGSKRYLTLKRLGQKFAMCAVLPKGADLAKVKLRENLSRAHFTVEERAAGRRELVKLVKAAGLVEDAAEKKGPGRPQSPERQERRAAAAAAGVSERTMERATKGTNGAAAKKAPPPLLLPEHQRLALEATGKNVPAAVSAIRRARKALDVAAAELDLVTKGSGPFVNVLATLKEVRSSCDSAETRLGKITFEGLCPYCKGVKKAMDDCVGCDALGLITEDRARDVPEELRIMTGPKAGIYLTPGKLTLLSEIGGDR